MTPTATPEAPVAEAPAPPPPPFAEQNPEAELAYRFVTETDRHVFLTGRAGTGKTTFLHRIRERLAKSYVVVAPTGVAAINAKGATIHSQLQLPFGLLSPARLRSPEARRNLARAKEQVLRRIDLLIIDEVSMVRADVIDAIDATLQRVRRNSRPFGGVQLLLIGDLHQLPPVVTVREQAELAALYPTPYFFSARALQDAGMVTVELERVYRQTDTEFVRLLGEVRANRMGEAVLRKLNSRYRDEESLGDLSGYVTLTTHRRTADQINAERLAATAGQVRQYRAEVRGNFPEGNYPTDETLELKVGAQVMFVKNDREGAYHNGKIGRVVVLEETSVTVDCGADGGRITVGRVRWENARYNLDSSTKEVTSEVAGSFEQIPLRLAWAITIHKSQGLTFDRVVIDAAAAFAHGQVYVALSRCRSFEGIIMRTRIGGSAVRTDRQVSEYTTEQRERRPNEDQLAVARIAYRRQLLRDAFEFGDLARAAQAFRRHGIVESRSYPGLREAELDALHDAIQDRVVAVAQRFGAQLEQALRETDLDGESVAVPARCREAVAYFREQLATIERDRLATLDLETDNTDAGERGEALRAEVTQAFKIARGVLAIIDADGFAPGRLVTERARLSLSDSGPTSGSHPARRSGPVKVANPVLYAMLTDWRSREAAEQSASVSEVVPSRVLRAICVALPQSAAALAKVEGMGGVRVKRYGDDLLGIVARFRADKSAGALVPATVTSGASATVALTLSMFGQGEDVDAIAAARGLSKGTILGHLAKGVEADLTRADDVVAAADQVAVSAYLDEHDGELTGCYAHFDGRLDHGLLKVARAIWARSQASETSSAE